MLNDLKKAKHVVQNILENHPETRDCDKKLWLSYLNRQHGLREILGEEAYNKFKGVLLHPKTCSMESVRRVRQKFQEEGLYVGTKRRVRAKEEQAVRDYIKS